MASPLGDTACIVGNGTAGPYFLTGRPLLSDTVQLRDACGLSIVDLTCGVLNGPGRLVFSRPIMPHDTVMVLFSALPFSLPTRYEIQHSQGQARPIAVESRSLRPPSTAQETPVPFKLDINGAKTFGVTVDNRRDVRTEQGLQLSVDGYLTETVALTAAVSDHFSDRHTSRAAATRLSELDQYFISVRGPHLAARLGDIEYVPLGTASVPSRRLSGAEARAFSTGRMLAVAAGKLEGIPRRTEFFPQVGRQGPYALLRGRRAVVPQSERLYVNSRLLERGPDRDYTIDYFTGEITFSPRISLSERDRIAAEFEESAQTYERRAAFAQLSNQNSTGRLAHQLHMTWEADDPEGAIGFRLSASDCDTLRQTGAHELSRDGALRVGAGRGEYAARDSSGRTIYEYVGPQNGDYRVSFEYVGAGNGTYVYVGGGAYGFAGDGKGDFSPTITVSAPASELRLSDHLRASQTPVGELDMSLAGLLAQPNRLNRASRAATWSHDLHWASSDTGRSAGTIRRFQAAARWRHLGREGTASSEISTIDLSNQWFLPTDRRAEGLDALESRARFVPSSWLDVAAEYGELAGSHTGSRDFESAAVDLPGSLALTFEHRGSAAMHKETDITRTREVWSLAQSWTRKWLAVSSGVHREDRHTAPVEGNRFEGYDLGLGVSTLRIGWAVDRVSDVPGRPILIERRHRWSGSGSLTLPGLGLSGAFAAARISRQRVADGRLTRDYSGQASVEWRWKRAGLTTAMTYTLNPIATRSLFESFIPVTEGFGDYRRQDTLLVPDPTGDFIRVLGSSGDLRPAASAQKEFTLRRSFGSAPGTGWSLLNDLSAELRVNRDETVDPDQISITGWMMPWGQLQTRKSGGAPFVLRTETTASVERRFAAASGNWFLRGRYDNRQDRFGSSRMGNLRRVWEFSARGNRPRRTWSTWEVSYSRQERRITGYTGVADAAGVIHEVSAALGLTLSETINAALQPSAALLRDRSGEKRSRMYGMSPSVTIRLGRRGKLGSLRSVVEYRFVESEVSAVTLPALTGGYTAGHNTRCLLDGRVDVSGSVALRMHSALDWLGRHRPRPWYRFNLQAVSSF